MQNSMSIGKFDPTRESITNYLERLEMGFILHAFTEDSMKRALLIHEIGDTNYDVLKSLVAPDKPADKTYAQLSEKLKSHFNPKPNKIVKRYEFRTRYRKLDENISDYIAALKKIAAQCEYGDQLEENIRDQLVCGVRDEGITNKLLQEVDLDYTKAITLATQIELSRKGAKSLTCRGGEDVGEINFTNRAKPKKSIATGKFPGVDVKKKIVCYRCGGAHKAPECKFKSEKCHNCGKIGHLKKVCKSKSKPPKTNLLEHIPCSASEVEESDTCFSFDLFGMNELKATSPIMKQVNVNGKPMNFQVDTGSSFTIMGYDKYEDFKDKYGLGQLKSVVAFPRTFTGEEVKMKGQVTVQVNIDQFSKKLSILVAPCKGPVLLGRDWISEINPNMYNLFPMEYKTKSENRQSKLDAILSEFTDVFDNHLGCVKNMKANIQIIDKAQPEFKQARPVPYAVRTKVEEELERLQENGVIEPVEQSEWAAPIVTRIKPSGQARICGDFKVTINKVTKPDKYPLPRIKDVYTKLNNGEKFTKLDLNNAFLQVELDQESQEYCTINTHKGLFRFTRMPFGITSAPSIFARLMDQVMQGLKGCAWFQDDIIITGKTDKEHMDNLIAVLLRLQKWGIKAKLEKCEFMKDRVEYLGYIIDTDGLHSTIDKLSKIANVKEPIDVNEVESFLGLVNYYRDFIPNASALMEPLNRLRRKDVTFHWGKNERDAFQSLKSAINNSSLLVHFNPNLPLKLTTDASQTASGGVLSHIYADGSERPIAFTSRTFTSAERNYSNIERESLAVIHGVKKFCDYLYGRSFTICSDHKPLEKLLGPTKEIPRMTSSRIQAWALYLSQFKYNFEYKPGCKIPHADFMSRVETEKETTLEHVEDQISSDTILTFEVFDEYPVINSKEIAKYTRRVGNFSVLERYIKHGFPEQSQCQQELLPFYFRKDELSIQRGCIMWGNRIVIPPLLRQRVLNLLHIGHPGINRMKELARSYTWWPKIDKDIEEKVRMCNNCQFARNSPEQNLNHPWERTVRVGERVHIDFAGPVDKHMLLILVDSHSKWIEAIPMKSTTASDTIEVLEEIFASIGLPETLVSDNGPQFTSVEFKLFCKDNNIRHLYSAPYHPSSNGLAERGVQTVKMMLKKNSGGSLQSRLNRSLFAYRSTPNASGKTPAEIMFGRQIRTKLTSLRPMDNDVKMKGATTSDRQLSVGQNVLFRMYKDNKSYWYPGKIVQKFGNVMYNIQDSKGLLHKRHIDQLIEGYISNYTDKEELVIPPMSTERVKLDTVQTQVQPSIVMETTEQIQGDDSALQDAEEQNVQEQTIRRSTRSTKGVPPVRLDY